MEAVILFAREPRLGRVKQRLARDLGETATLTAYRRMVERGLRLADRFTRSRPGCRLYVALEGHCDDPGSLAARAGALGARVERQVGGGLGRRMLACLQHAQRDGAARMLLMGCDCPSARAGDLRAALDTLIDHDLVLAPTVDGGYWLIGVREPEPSLFRAMPWGEDTVAARTLSVVQGLGWRSLCLPLREDIDDIGAWRRWQSERAQRGLAERP
ncbi:MAG: TIGR04282 family arsenosugar biosynthesis glycosyltransferase [Burkholderiaceae bacterium]